MREGIALLTLRRRFQPDVSRWYPRATVKPMSRILIGDKIYVNKRW
jgi:hypothetical protein